MNLDGGPGTGNKILESWDQFSFELIGKDVGPNGRGELYTFNFKFNEQVGRIMVVRKKTALDDWYIDGSTFINSDSFIESLMLYAYDDTSIPTDGLYKVAEKMIQTF